jgi:membrane protein implicated in regulation of membrane protease activity
VRETIASFDAAIVAGKGAGLGVAASTGAWILVAHLGTASTGTAIVGLSGAAAHNAILAWFGGGALAAGGGGMALGVFTIGGLVALPLIAFSAYKSYTEASRIDDVRKEVEQANANNIQNTEKLNQIKTEIVKLRDEVIEKRSRFVLEFGFVREESSKLAYKMASSANSFAADLMASSRARGATM